MKKISVLETLGLGKHEITIYIAIVELGTASIARITKHTRLHRPTIYKFLPSLIEKNLISFSVIGKRKIYSAESPTRLKNLLEHVTSDLEKIIPDLVNMYDQRSPQPTIKFQEGEKAMTWVYEDVLNTCKKGDVFYRYESPKDYIKNDAHLPTNYLERICRKKEIQKFVITNEKTAHNKPKVIERESKYIPKNYDLFEYDITQIVYNNKVAFIDYNTYTAWIIENTTFAKFQKQIFKLLFGKL